MTNPPPLDQHGEQVRRRWQVHPTPRNALDLAEELRRHERLAEAIRVLQKTVDSHPGHLAPRVALGRFHLELGQYDEAARALEGVVEQDPTHLVANKLLVDLYLQIGERKKARDRLDLYRLLNESDPEIESLQERLDGKAAAAEAAGPATLVEAPEVEETAEPVGDLAPGEPAGAAESAEARTMMAPLETLAPRAEPTEAPEVPRPEAAAAMPEVVAEAAPAAPEVERLSREVPFDLPRVAAQAPALDAAARPASTDLEPRPAPGAASPAEDQVAVFVADPRIEPFARLSEGLELGDQRGPAPAEGIFSLAAALPGPAVATVEAVEGALAVEPAPAPRPAPETLPEIEVEEEVAPAAAPAPSEVPAAEAPAPIPEPPAPVTATLAELYLEQGHLAEAEQAFREVLVREPDNDLARQRLADIRRRRSPRLTATEMLVGAASDLEPAQRRVHVLESYLRRIRANAEADEA